MRYHPYTFDLPRSSPSGGPSTQHDEASLAFSGSSVVTISKKKYPCPYANISVQPGLRVPARQTVTAQGKRGSTVQSAIKHSTAGTIWRSLTKHTFQRLLFFLFLIPAKLVSFQWISTWSYNYGGKRHTVLMLLPMQMSSRRFKIRIVFYLKVGA